MVTHKSMARAWALPDAIEMPSALRSKGGIREQRERLNIAPTDILHLPGRPAIHTKQHRSKKEGRQSRSHHADSRWHEDHAYRDLHGYKPDVIWAHRKH
jgi:hypothetical protein